MNWCNIEIDHVEPSCMFVVSNDKDLAHAFNWKNTEPVSKHIHQQKGTKYNLFVYRLQFIKAHQFIKLNEGGYKEGFPWWDTQ